MKSNRRRSLIAVSAVTVALIGISAPALGSEICETTLTVDRVHAIGQPECGGDFDNCHTATVHARKAGTKRNMVLYMGDGSIKNARQLSFLQAAHANGTPVTVRYRTNARSCADSYLVPQRNVVSLSLAGLETSYRSDHSEKNALALAVAGDPGFHAVNAFGAL